MARALLIFNPAAARTDRDVVRSVSRVFVGAGWEIDVASTTRTGHAGELARQGVADRVDVIAVYGGDGTTMQAVAGIVGHDVPVGLIPGGAGNLLAGNLRLPRNPAAAARVVAHGKPRPIDLGRVHRGDGVHYFGVACGAGFDAELMAATTEVAKRRWGMGAYVAGVVKALGRVLVVPCRITVDGATTEAEAATVLVANCREVIPPFLRLNADTKLDDGFLDVAVLNACSVVETAELVLRLMTGRIDNSDRVQFLRGQHVTVETEVTRPVELDGEPAGVTPFTAEIVPGAMRVVVPT